MNEQRFPAGCDADHAKRLIDHYESLSEEELIAEDEAAANQSEGQAVITVSDELLPAIRHNSLPATSQRNLVLRRSLSAETIACSSRRLMDFVDFR
jgi:hypothetical protein